MGQFLTCEASEGQMDVYVASPDSGNKVPVVIVLQEVFGVNHHIRSVCDRLAKEGFLAVAPDMFYRDGKRIEITYGDKAAFMPLLQNMTNEKIVMDVQDTKNFISVLPTADATNVSVMGFCVGGFSSALVSTKIPFHKVISFYGAGMVHEREGVPLKPIIQDFGKIKSDTLFFFGGRDASIPHNDVVAITKSLEVNHVKHEVVVYPNSDHGFFCDERKSYNQEDASLAWKKTLQFLRS